MQHSDSHMGRPEEQPSMNARGCLQHLVVSGYADPDHSLGWHRPQVLLLGEIVEDAVQHPNTANWT